jgi:NitT/TauT family transport system substrate-binding protein
MTKHHWRSAAAGLLLALAATPLAAQTPRPVTVGILYIAADAGLFIAKERGYFAEQGLDVQLNRFTSAADIVALLATNKLDVGSGSATPGLYNSFKRGLDVQIVTSKAVMIAPDFGTGNLLVRKDLVESGAVKTIADLKGKRIAVNNIQSTSLNYVLRGIAVGGLVKEDVTLIELPFSQFIPALEKKAVDAQMVYAPLSDTISKKLGLAVDFPDANASRTANGDTVNVMFYSDVFAKSEAGKGFMLAHLKGIRDYYRAILARKADKGPICTIIHKYVDNIPNDCAGVTLSGADPNGAVNVESLERYQTEWLKWGVMSEPADIRAHINTSFVDAAIAKLGRYEP